MFRTLRRLVAICCWLALAAVLIFLFVFRRGLDPAVDLVRSLAPREGARQHVEGELDGRAVRVFSGDTFQLEAADGRMFTVRLTGIAAPDARSSRAADRLRAGRSRTNLSRLLLARPVSVRITGSNETWALYGLVRTGETNVNARLVETGAAALRPDLMNGLPWSDRYALVRADRLAQRGPGNGTRE